MLVTDYHCDDIPCSQRTPNQLSNSCKLKDDNCGYYKEWENVWSGCINECPSKLFENISITIVICLAKYLFIYVLMFLLIFI
jgi:hypothetical protein